MSPSPRRLARPILRAVLALLPVAVSAACASPTPPPPTAAELAAPGPLGVGVRTFTFVDTSRPTAPNGTFPGAPSRTLVTEVYYPAAAPGRDAALATTGAPYPLVIHSHGFMAFRTAEAYLAEHLASHGYVVAAADYPLSSMGAPGGPTVADVGNQPGDVRFVIDQLLALSAQPGGPLGGAIDPARIGTSGLSLGGLTTLLATFHGKLRDPRIRAALPMAPAACMLTARFYQAAAVPLLVMHGDSDLLLPAPQHGARAFERAQDPRYLALLRRGSHTGFTGFASFFDQSKHFDRLGCAAIAGKTDGGFAGLGTEEDGVSADPASCPLPCQATPEDPSLGADRHHDIVRAAALAFFQAHLRAGEDAAAARAALVEGLPMDSPELTVRTR